MASEIEKFLEWVERPFVGKNEVPPDAKLMAAELRTLQKDREKLLMGAEDLFEKLPQAAMLGARLRLAVQEIKARHG